MFSAYAQGRSSCLSLCMSRKEKETPLLLADEIERTLGSYLDILNVKSLQESESPSCLGFYDLESSLRSGLCPFGR